MKSTCNPFPVLLAVLFLILFSLQGTAQTNNTVKSDEGVKAEHVRAKQQYHADQLEKKNNHSQPVTTLQVKQSGEATSEILPSTATVIPKALILSPEKMAAFQAAGLQKQKFSQTASPQSSSPDTGDHFITINEVDYKAMTKEERESFEAFYLYIKIVD